MLWWRSQLASYLWKPKEWVSTVINQAKTSINFTKNLPMIGIHVRRTDKSTEDQVYSTDAHIRRATQFSAQFLVNNMFIATDDPAVIFEIGKNMENDKELIGLR